MEEQAWKTVVAAAVFTLIILAIFYFLISPSEIVLEKGEAGKSAEFKNIYVSGRKEGQKSWEFFARNGWATKNQEATYLFEVKNGKIYKEGKLLMKNLTAKRAIAFRKSNVVEAFGFGEGSPEVERLDTDIDLGRVSEKEKDKVDWVRLKARKLKYFENDKKSEAEGQVEIAKKSSRILSEKMSIDHETKTAQISEKVRLIRKDGDLSALAIEYRGQEEKLIAQNNVKLRIREGKKKPLLTRVNSNRAVFYTDSEKDFNFEGSAEVWQNHKMSVAGAGLYSPKKKELFLSNGVISILEKGGVILQEDTAANLRNPEVKKILKEKTIIRSNQLALSTYSGDSQAVGSVEVSQRGREARGELGKYDDKKETLTLTGKVFLKKGKDWVKCREVIVSVKDETFEAAGVEEAEFKL